MESLDEGGSIGVETKSTLTRRTASPRPGVGAVFVLRVTAGPTCGATSLLDWSANARVIVGQSRTCDVPLADPSVSRRHVSLSAEGDGVRIVDLDSTNGTRVDGLRVRDALLCGGETITLGDTELRLVRTGMEGCAPTRRELFGRLVGRALVMERLFDLAARVAPSPLPLLVEGEPGTGKTLLAEAIHEASGRASGPLVSFDARAVDPDADDAYGALLDAAEAAQGGTLVLEHVDALGPREQGRLAAILQANTLPRDGQWRPFDARVVAVTSRDLDREVQEGRFREDLLYSLSGVRLDVPPLRERHGDVTVLAQHFWRRSGGEGDPPKSVVLLLQREKWPGNVAELAHAVARRVLLGRDPEPRAWLSRERDEGRGVSDSFIDDVVAARLSLPEARQRVIRELERRYLAVALEDHGGNVTRAAASSGLTRRHFHNLLAKDRSRAK